MVSLRESTSVDFCASCAIKVSTSLRRASDSSRKFATTSLSAPIFVSCEIFSSSWLACSSTTELKKAPFWNESATMRRPKMPVHVRQSIDVTNVLKSVDVGGFSFDNSAAVVVTAS